MARRNIDGEREGFPVGIAILVVLGLVSVGVIVWGIQGSKPAPVASAQAVDVNFVAVKRGALTEQTTVTGTLSRGEIVSLAVPAAASRGGASSATGATTGTATTGATGGFGSTARPTGTASTTTAAPTTTTTTTTTTTAPPPPPATTTTTTVPAGPTTTVDPTATTVAPTTTIGPAPTTTEAPARGERPVTPSTTAAPPTTAARRATPTTTPASPTGGAGSTPTAAATRIVTALAPVGTVLKPGDTVFAIDGRPTVLMTGSVPAWRTIDKDTTDGVDVQQLESSLKAAGFDDGGDLTVDDHVDSSTVAAIDEWQKSLGIAQTGSVAFGEVIFETTEVTVVALNGSVGAVATPGDSLLDIRKGEPYVDISTDSSWVSPGAKVSVGIDRTRVTGTVSTLSAGIARVVLAPQANLRDGASVTVTLSRTKIADQMLVPATAILVSDIDGPTVRVKNGDSVRTVGVDVVASADDQAAVTPRDGELKVGDEVRAY